MTRSVLIYFLATVFFVGAFLYAHRGENRTWSFSAAFGMIMGFFGGILVAAVSLFIPLTDTELKYVAQNEGQCVSQTLAEQTGVLNGLDLFLAKTHCGDIEDREYQNAALTHGKN